jgi:hypothetical protein
MRTEPGNLAEGGPARQCHNRPVLTLAVAAPRTRAHRNSGFWTSRYGSSCTPNNAGVRGQDEGVLRFGLNPPSFKRRRPPLQTPSPANPRTAVFSVSCGKQASDEIDSCFCAAAAVREWY